MESSENQNQSTPFFQTITARMLMVGLLALFLLIPLEFVKSLIFERSVRQKETVSEISQKWGDSVLVYGPVLKVPYRMPVEEQQVDPGSKKVIIVTRTEQRFAYFFPDRLDNVTAAKTSKRSRGNYESTVFTAEMRFSGRFNKPVITDSTKGTFEWEKAKLLVRTTDLKGIRNEQKITFGNKSYTLSPVFDEDSKRAVGELETGYLGTDFASAAQTDFRYDVAYNGSGQIRFVPVGKVTSVKMTSDWKTPGFQGHFIPAAHTSDANGFTADWKVLPVSRPFAQQYFGQFPNLEDFAFGVDFVVPVDEYLQNERASKYGFLMIALTFLAFFLISTVNRISIHIFQYAMIGVALLMFYTLLISITEHSSFGFAYGIASCAVIALISLYSISILKDRRFPLLIAAALTTVYGFIYIIIQMEDYALLVGSIGLFVILAAVMYFSRKIEWKN